jgi:AraC-like DNA-binding protein
VATQRVELTLAEGPGEANLMFRRKPGLTHSRHWIEFSVAVIAERIRQTVGERLAFDVEFAHDPPRRLTRHRRFFGGRVTFSMPCDRLTLEPSLLDRPLRTASAALAEVLDARLSELEAVAPAADPFLDRVRRAVLSSLDAADPGLPRTLALLQMSRRTFQRQLQRRKTSYKHLLDEARRARASSLLDKDLTVAEVSERLGFSEPSAFFRAFRRWTGGSPKGNVAPSARRAPPS